MANLHPKLLVFFIGVALLALVVRLPRLDERPMHTDEAVNAYITGQLFAGQKYQYDPRDRHGPALYALSFPLARVTGAKSYSQLTETAVRLGPALIGAAMILMFGAAAKRHGFVAAAVAALLFALGPLPVYYSRYFIHETLFVAASLGLLLSGWRLLVSRTVEAGVAAGFYAGIMLACKESALLHFAALGVAGAAGFFILRGSGREKLRSQYIRPETMTAGIVGGLVAFVAVVVVAYSWGGTNWNGLFDLFRSVPHLTARATGQGHEKPAEYYLMLLSDGKSGVLVLALAVLGSLGVIIRLKRRRVRVIPKAQYPPPTPLADPPALTLTSQGGATEKESPAHPHSPQTQATLEKQQEIENEYVYEREQESALAERKAFAFLLIYTVVIGALYSAIPYKTPWLALNLWLPLTLLAGFGCALLWRYCSPVPLRALLVVGACAIIAVLGRDTWQRAFAKSSDENNPYAYAHTSEDLLRLPDRLAALKSPIRSGTGLRIAVVAADPWPLPWYLRKFSQVGYWSSEQNPGTADIYITSPEAGERLGTRLRNWRPEFFGLRPGVLIVLWTPPEKEAGAQ